jgi:hypothetical protein
MCCISPNGAEGIPHGPAKMDVKLEIYGRVSLTKRYTGMAKNSTCLKWWIQLYKKKSLDNNMFLVFKKERWTSAMSRVAYTSLGGVNSSGSPSVFQRLNREA